MKIKNEAAIFFLTAEKFWASLSFFLQRRRENIQQIGQNKLNGNEAGTF